MSDQGRVKEFPAGQYQVAEQPSFYDGYLVVSNINGYFYLRASDDEVIGPFTGAMPFTEGYAVVKVPNNPKKVLGGDYTIQVLSAKTGKLERLNLGEYDTDDVDFISGVSNGKSIIVLKKRFHEYDFSKGTLTPIHIDGNIANKKSRVMANERPVQVMSGENGFLVQDSLDDFEARLRALYADRPQVRRVGAAASRSIVRSWEDVVDEVLDRYNHIIARKSQIRPLK